MSLEINLDTSFDRIFQEPIVLLLFDERLPLHGFPGIVDWELCGELSRMIAERKFEGKEKARMILYLRSSCHHGRKVLVYGLGKKNTLTSNKLSMLTEDLLVALSNLSLYNVVHVMPSLYDLNSDVQGLLAGAAYAILKFTSAEDREYRFWLMWDGVSRSEIVNSFKGATGILPDAPLSIIEKED